MKRSLWPGPLLIGLGIGLLAGVAVESLLDGVIAAIASFVGLLCVEVQPFARSLPAQPRTIGVGWGDEVETDSGHSDPQTQPPRGDSFEVAPPTGKR